jgi:hypothetical protein
MSVDGVTLERDCESRDRSLSVADGRRHDSQRDRRPATRGRATMAFMQEDTDGGVAMHISAVLEASCGACLP